MRWPWLAIGSVPTEDSISILDQSRPVLIWTEATLVMLMLISSWLNQERLRRVINLSLTSMRVGKSRLPWVQRLAQKLCSCHKIRYSTPGNGRPAVLPNAPSPFGGDA